jgi:hypothetical protein
MSDATGMPAGRFEEVASRLHEVEAQLGEIDAALNRLDDGTYGTCQSCGRGLSDNWLEVDPTARWCEDCRPAPSGEPTAGESQTAGEGQTAGDDQTAGEQGE